jgi:hypothetical protein
MRDFRNMMEERLTSGELDELVNGETYLLSELDSQRYEPDGMDKDLENLYYKVKDFPLFLKNTLKFVLFYLNMNLSEIYLIYIHLALLN